MRVLTACLLLLLLLPTSASGYTLVMRGGRRVEIADGFRLHGTQLTYEAAPGVSVTLPLDLVDVAETERANGEPSGSFLRRAAAPADARQRQSEEEARSAAAQARPAARTLTNRELEPARRARIESERAYERRRVELGLPSAEESRRRDQEEEQAMRERARRQAEADAGAESYWRERAAALREEAGALDAEIGYLRSLLAETSGDSSAGFTSSPGLAAAALTVVAGPNYRFGRGGFAHNLPTGTAFARNPANALLQNFGGGHFGGRHFGRARHGATLGFGVNGGTRAGFGLFKRDSRAHFPRRHHRGRFAHRGSHFFAPGLVGIVAPFDYSSADAAALLTRLRLLEAERAGLSARWRQLEDESRRAGALPGWLRP